MTHMYGKDISIDISAQREHDVNTFRQDRRWMYGVDLMPKNQTVDILTFGNLTAKSVRQIIADYERSFYDSPIVLDRYTRQWEYM